MSTTLIVVEATITMSDREHRDDAVARSAPIQAATRADEPGCLVYCFAADPVRDDVVQVYELWADEASLAAHFEHPNYHEMRQLLGTSGMVGATSRKLRVDATAPVYGADGVASASFDS